MSFAKWVFPIVCAASALHAQSFGDLNGLIASASHYASHGMSSSHDARPLELCRVSGDNGGDPNVLMTRSVDVNHWSFLYRLGGVAPLDAPEADAAPKPFRSAMLECTQGIFGGFKYSAAPLPELKSLEFTWVAVSLDSAIAQLNNAGYVRGFDSVTLMRPSNLKYPDGYVYLFNCPWERTRVAISTQTGAFTWRQMY